MLISHDETNDYSHLYLASFVLAVTKHRSRCVSLPAAPPEDEEPNGKNLLTKIFRMIFWIFYWIKLLGFPGRILLSWVNLKHG